MKADTTAHTPLHCRGASSRRHATSRKNQRTQGIELTWLPKRTTYSSTELAKESSTTNQSGENVNPLATEMKRKLVQRVIEGAMFQRAPALRRFLSYICDQTMSGHIENVKEYTIGVHALDRQRNYDPRPDNIVRVRAGELRKRLEQYFTSEGDEEPIIIKVPRGTYVPEFSRR